MDTDLAQTVRDAVTGRRVRELPGLAARLVARHGGRFLSARWCDAQPPAGVDIGPALPLPAAATTVEVTLVRGLSRLDTAALTRPAAHRFRGLHGLWLPGGDRVTGLGMLVANRGPNAALARMGGSAGDAQAAIEDSFLVDLARGEVHPLFRGQVLVTRLTRADLADMAAQMTGWLAAQVGRDGRTTYKYWPSSGRYSTADNMIRQFMATAALARAARRDPHLAPVARRNATFAFARHYREEDGLGLIPEGAKIKLGAAAVALIAACDMSDPAPYAGKAAALTRFILHMQNPDGSFRTFLRPAGRNDCQNFYPGEAMLALMRRWQVTRDPRLLAAVHRAFAYYAPWHLADPNPAFVPWHTMALSLFHAATRRPEIADFVFRINDWLCHLQATAGPPDTLGAFYREENARFGPPHASSTGVYCEGLVEALRLARAQGDGTRERRYRRALIMGLRSLRQLQYRDDVAMFAIRHKSRVRGAIRTATHDNEVRIDNVQHALMAAWGALDSLSEADFGMDDPALLS
jgi:hypothetical protein